MGVLNSPPLWITEPTFAATFAVAGDGFRDVEAIILGWIAELVLEEVWSFPMEILLLFTTAWEAFSIAAAEDVVDEEEAADDFLCCDDDPEWPDPAAVPGVVGKWLTEDLLCWSRYVRKLLSWGWMAWKNGA